MRIEDWERMVKERIEDALEDEKKPGLWEVYSTNKAWKQQLADRAELEYHIAAARKELVEGAKWLWKDGRKN